MQNPEERTSCAVHDEDEKAAWSVTTQRTEKRKRNALSRSDSGKERASRRRSSRRQEESEGARERESERIRTGTWRLCDTAGGWMQVPRYGQVFSFRAHRAGRIFFFSSPSGFSIRQKKKEKEKGKHRPPVAIHRSRGPAENR